MWRLCVLWLIYAAMEVAPQVTERVGCFTDSNIRILTGLFYKNSGSMTVDLCLNKCLIQRGDLFAGLEAGFACFCGNDTDHTKYGPQRPDSECRQSPCEGNRSQPCGGLWRMDIYRDYNECSLHNGGCGMACINTPLSYYCDCHNAPETEECSCQDGFVPVDGGEMLQCTDWDECDVDDGGCNQECVNSPGAYHCACHTGYRLVGGEKRNCTDVNECTDDPDLCSMDNFECINTPGSYQCECKPGYIQSNGSCSDIDECSLGDDKCNQNCNNTDGDYICSCMTVYQFTGGQLYNCTDVDECTEGSHQCDQTCINTPGQYQCTCELGYHMEQDVFTCFECANGTYGIECKETCQCGDTNICNASTGACFKALQQTNGNGMVALSVGILVPAILVTLGVIGVIAIFRRRKYKAQKTVKDDSDNVIATTAANRSSAYENVVVDVDNVVILENPHSIDDICDNSKVNRRPLEQHTLSSNIGPENSPCMPTTTTHKQQQTSIDTCDADANVHTNFILVAELDSYADDTSGIENEYKSVLLRYGMQTEAMGDDWRQKNKYKNIMPYEYNRVKLSKNELPYSDYINASYIHIPNSTDTTIAAQGPIPETVPDFWRIVWEKNVLIIVMLTKEIENTKMKCTHYWPDSDLMQHGNLVIRPIDAAEYPDFVIRRFEIFQIVDLTKRQTVHQFQFTSWPDKDVPENVAPLLRFYRKIRATSIPGTSTVVHCSAGVGRSGTFIALHWLLRQAKDEHGVDVLKCLHQLREQRMQMIQTLKQYMFLYNILRDTIAVGETAITHNDVTGLYSNLQSTVSSVNYSILRRQYEIVSQMPASTLKTAVGNIPQSDAGRAHLMSGASDSINAVKIKGYKKSETFLANQWPFDVTVEHLWRIIYDHKIHAVVVLEDMTQSDGYPTFLPSKDNSLRAGDSRVHLLGEVTRVQTIGEMSVMISIQTHLAHGNIYSNVGESQAMATNEMDHKVWILSILESHPLSVEQVVVLNERLAGLKLGSESTVVISRDGGELCGKYIAISILLQMLREENEMDLFYVVQQIKSCRPEFFSSEASYIELHKLMQCYLEQQK